MHHIQAYHLQHREAASSILRIKNHRFYSQFWEMSLSFKLITQPDLGILKNSTVVWERLWMLGG